MQENETHTDLAVSGRFQKIACLRPDKERQVDFDQYESARDASAVLQGISRAARTQVPDSNQVAHEKVAG